MTEKEEPYRVMKVYITGGGWITAEGFGRLSERKQPVRLTPGTPSLPKGKDIFPRPLARYGRFDTYTKAGCAGIALALSDAGLAQAEEKRPIGMVTSSKYECLETDMNFYKTTLVQGGKLSSPNLFSYTLPGIVLGESAACFRLTGPTFCVGDKDGEGMAAMLTASDILRAEKTPIMLAGWLEAPPEAIPGAVNIQSDITGALFIAMETDTRKDSTVHETLLYKDGILQKSDGTRLTSMLDLFQ